VAQDFELRKTIRGVGGKYRVIKNNLARKRPRERGRGSVEGPEGHDLAGLHGLRPGSPGKALTSYAKTNPRWCSSRDGRGPGDRDQIPYRNWLTCLAATR